MNIKDFNTLRERMRKHPDYHTIRNTDSGLSFTLEGKRLEIYEKEGTWYVRSGNYRVGSLGPKNKTFKQIHEELTFIVKNITSIKQNFRTWNR